MQHILVGILDGILVGAVVVGPGVDGSVHHAVRVAGAPALGPPGVASA